MLLLQYPNLSEGARLFPQSLYPNLSDGAAVSLDSSAEIKSAAPSVAYVNLAEFGGRCLKAVLGMWVSRS